jgi:glycosyltransferase involved in cell wall biosynthesis
MGAAIADRARVQVTVCCLRGHRDRVFAMPRSEADAGVDYVEVLERHSFDPLVWPRLRQIVIGRGIDVLHAHDYQTSLLALLLARAERVAPLTTVHDSAGTLRHSPDNRKILAGFPRLIAVSSGIARELVDQGAPAGRITTMLNAVDHRRFRRNPARVAEARAAFELQPEHVAICAIGRLEQPQRFDLLLDAFAKVHARLPYTRLIIAGSGTQQGRLAERCSRLGLNGACLLAGQVSDVILLHHACDLFVQSADDGGTHSAVLEAMAMETPVVATAAAGTAELVHDGVHGRIVSPGSVERLVDGIQVALANPGGTRRMAVNARQRVEGELSFEARVRRVEDIYHEVAGGTVTTLTA